MIRQLLRFNWKVFKSSLTTAKLFVLLVYGLLLFLIFANFTGIVFSIVSIQNNAELYKQYSWMTPDRSRFILLVFANLMWLSQFVFTSVRQLQLQENRKLLTIGYPLTSLARHLTCIRFFHPVNLLFNVVWFLLLFIQSPSLTTLPIILAALALNYALIVSFKFRFLNAVRDYQKWILLFSVVGIFTFSMKTSDIINPATFGTLDLYIPTINAIARWLPGGLLAFHTMYISSQAITYITVMILASGASWYLFKDHYQNTRKALQAPATDRSRQSDGNRLSWFCRVFGSQAGKFLYYVTSHPYNRIQALFFILFPAVYLPLALSENSGGEAASNFLVFFFLMYTPLGFMILSVGNIFGYENRELLLHMQLPIHKVRQIQDRYLGALILPASIFAIITLIEVLLFIHSPQLLTAMLGNIFILLCLLTVFTWSSVSQYSKIPWVSFSFTQPVISKSAAMVSGVFMIISSIIIYVPYHSYEPVKQVVLLAGILMLGFINYRRYRNIYYLFKTKVLPRLWIEL